MINSDEKYMAKCLQLAEEALASGNPPVGSVLVLDGKIIGQGIESGKSTGDITNHAEIMAIRDAIANGFVNELSRTVLYSTHEPCIMCSYLIRHHKIPRIVFGTSVEYIGGFTSIFGVLTTEEVPKWGVRPKITTGICQAACDSLSDRFSS